MSALRDEAYVVIESKCLEWKRLGYGDPTSQVDALREIIAAASELISQVIKG